MSTTPTANDEAALQLDEKVHLGRLLTPKGIDKALLIDFLDDAERSLTAPGSLPARSQSLAGRTVANRSSRSSTRSRASIDLAGKPRSVIMQQLTNGLAARVAVLDRVVRTMAAA